MTTSVQSLASWLLERITEDEAEARQPQYDWTPYGSWTPAQVLEVCEAHRRIVELHADANADWQDGSGDVPSVCAICEDRRHHDAERWPCLTLRLLAVPYADRPGYDERWRP